MIDLKLRCPLCGGTEFKKKEGSIDSLNYTSHKVTLMICGQCNHMILFGKGRSIFDFD